MAPLPGSAVKMPTSNISFSGAAVSTPSPSAYSLRASTVTATSQRPSARRVAVTQVVFRNYQWGAEKRNSTLWYDDNFVGTELDKVLLRGKSIDLALEDAERLLARRAKR